MPPLAIIKPFDKRENLPAGLVQGVVRLVSRHVEQAWKLLEVLIQRLQSRYSNKERAGRTK